MQYQYINNCYIVYVEKDEKMVETLTRFCKKNNIWNAQLSGIGAVKSVDIGAYDTNKKEYIRHKLPEVWELVNCQGNVILKDEEPFIHVHVTLSDHNLNTKGGHLFESTIAAVGEFFVRKLDSQVSRKFDIDIGLPCLSLEKKFK